MVNDSTTLVPGSRFELSRWLLPSVTDLIFLALFCLLIFTSLSVRLLGDAGVGWHIRTGQLILKTHAIPRSDPFSSSMSGHPWFAWEWLYDLAVGWQDAMWGLNGVVVFTALIIALTFSLAFRLLLRRRTNFLVALILVLLAISASMIHFLARPHVLSWLFTLLFFWILDSSERVSANGFTAYEIQQVRNSRRRLWLMPCMMLFWVNLHGGFVIGFVLLAIYWLSAAWEWLKPAPDRLENVVTRLRAATKVKYLTLVGIVSIGSTLLNPHGIRLYLHIYQYLSNRFLMNHIDEFQSPNFHYVAQKCFAGLLLITLVALAIRSRAQKKIGVSHSLIIIFAVYSGLYASRNLPTSSLLLILIIGPWLSAALEQFSEQRSSATGRTVFEKYAKFSDRMQTVELNLRGHLWCFAAFVFAIWVVAHGGKLGGKTLIDAHFDAKRFPVAAVDYIERNHLTGPVFAPDYWGGYLIYRLYPHMQVVMDDRHDLYGESFLKSYLTTMHLEPGWEDFLREHPAECLVLPKDSALSNLLDETRGWHRIYGDNVAALFVPSSEITR